jgi:hypothetical protein
MGEPPANIRKMFTKPNAKRCEQNTNDTHNVIISVFLCDSLSFDVSAAFLLGLTPFCFALTTALIVSAGFTEFFFVSVVFVVLLVVVSGKAANVAAKPIVFFFTNLLFLSINLRNSK